MGDIIPERTTVIIAAEINIIKHQTEKMVLTNFIEIGRRLAEAKGLVKYGEWGKWLKEEVGFSQNRAEKLMRLYEEFGREQSPLGDAGALGRELPNLSYTHALILLGVPEEDRAQFIRDIDIESMTTRELEQAVKEVKESQREKADLQEALAEEKEKYTRLAQDQGRLVQEQDNLKKEAGDLRKSKQELQQDVEKKTRELKKMAENSNFKSYQKVSNELAAAQIKLLTSKVAFRLEGFEKWYKELSYEMTLLAKVDDQVHGEYAKQLNEFLVKTIKERMGK